MILDEEAVVEQKLAESDSPKEATSLLCNRRRLACCRMKFVVRLVEVRYRA